jgi:hypothetical protein
MASVSVAFAPLLWLFVAGDPLLVKSGDTYKEGVVVLVKRSPTEVTLKAVKAEAKAVAELLREKLPGADVGVDGDIVTIKGTGEKEVLEKISSLTFDTSTQFAMEMPEAGGSIRVGRTLEIPPDSRAGEEGERFKARIVGVAKGKFPDVTLKLKITGAPKALDWQKKLKKVTYITARVALGQKNGLPDLGNPLTQANLTATYLKAGDDVVVHVTEIKGNAAPDNFLIDYVERL